MALDITTVTAIGAALVLVIGAIVTGVVTIISALRATKVAVETTVIADVKRDEKLDRIEVLVDGRYSQVLQELADVKALLAKATGLPLDEAKAVVAQTTANEQAVRVSEATQK